MQSRSAVLCSNGGGGDNKGASRDTESETDSLSQSVAGQGK